jgi:thioredoxin 1
MRFLEINDETFEAEVLKSPQPVLVDFYTSWCGPCKAMEPALKELAHEYAGEVRIVKVDIEASPLTASTYSVRSIPTFIMVRGGEVKGRLTGSQTRTRISAVMEACLGQADV